MVRQQLRRYLEDLDSPQGRITNLAIAALVLLSSGIFILQTYSIPPALSNGLEILNTGILWIFALEYGLRFWVAEARLRHLIRLYSLIDLVAILPFFIGVIDISFLRVFRWFRILRLVRLFEKQTLFGLFRGNDSAIFIRILFTLFSILFVYSGLIYQVEHSVNAQHFGTFLDAFYFSVVTMTTVGFGDLTPASEMGRLLTVLMILTGIALIPWQIGDLIKRLVKSANQINSICVSCGLALHDADADYCKRCGTELRKSCVIQID